MIRNILLAATALTVMSATASAADLPTSKGAPIAPIVYAPVFTWTGFYVGLNAGYGWQRARHVSSFDSTVPGASSIQQRQRRRLRRRRPDRLQLADGPVRARRRGRHPVRRPRRQGNWGGYSYSFDGGGSNAVLRHRPRPPRLTLSTAPSCT